MKLSLLALFYLFAVRIHFRMHAISTARSFKFSKCGHRVDKENIGGYKTGEGSFKWGEVTPVAEVVNVKRAAK